MATITISTDSSLVADGDVISLQLSPKSNNLLSINDDNELTIKDIDKFKGQYFPLNGIAGEYNTPMQRIECDSSVTRLANWNSKDADDSYSGDINNDGRPGPEDGDGVNLIGLFTELGVSLNVTFWPKECYANNVTFKGEWES